MKYFIISQPKSGTYLLSNVLQFLNILPSNLHISETHYEDYSNKGIDAVTNPKKYSYNIPINESLLIIPKNHFAVGHIPYNKNNELLLTNFKKILITRNIKDIKESWVRFNKEFKRKNGFNKQLLDKILMWEHVNNVHHITFESIIKKEINAIDNLQLFLFNKIIKSSEDVLTQALLSQSLTKSSIR